MNKRIRSIKPSLKLYSFGIAICVLMILPAIQTFHFLNETAYTLEKVTNENSTDDQERSENKNPDEKTEFQIVGFSYHHHTYSKRIIYRKGQELISDFDPKIFTPPPEINTKT